MFVVEDVVPESITSEFQRMVDHDRQVWMQVVERNRLRVTFKLVWQDKVIPFKARQFHPTTERYVPIGVNKSPRHWEISLIGSGASPGIADYTFLDEEERDKISLLVIESLLEYGSAYTGNKHDDDIYSTVDFKGKIYRKEDFY